MSKLADNIVDKVGSWRFVIIFTAITLSWIIASFFGLDKELSLLTLALSILAIYLTVFILISQNKEQKQFGDWLKEDLNNTKQVNGKLDEILKEKNEKLYRRNGRPNK